MDDPPPPPGPSQGNPSSQSQANKLPKIYKLKNANMEVIAITPGATLTTSLTVKMKFQLRNGAIKIVCKHSCILDTPPKVSVPLILSIISIIGINTPKKGKGRQDSRGAYDIILFQIHQLSCVRCTDFEYL